MMIDASAIVGILNGESDAPVLAAAIGAAKAPYTSPIAIYEATVALMRENKWSGDEAGEIVRQFLDAASIEVAAVSDAMATAAIHAFERFGKGRHPAQLNMGDCFAYACARARNAPLLFKGEDFPRTDVNDRES
jgi:ribonuclease VapC